MTAQLALTLTPPRFPRARLTDPSSSHAAAARLERSGRDKVQREQVLAAFRRFPLATTAEIAKLAGIDRTTAARRAPELAKDGLLRRYEPSKDMKPCEVTGIRCVRWCEA